MKLSPSQIRINYASHSERQDKRYFKFPFYIYLICLPSPSLDLQSSIQMFSFPFCPHNGPVRLEECARCLNEQAAGSLCLILRLCKRKAGSTVVLKSRPPRTSLSTEEKKKGKNSTFNIMLTVCCSTAVLL